MILTEDKRVSPPPYSAVSQAHQPKRTTPTSGIGFSELPPNVLLQVVEATFPSYRTPNGPELQRRNFYWLTISLRLVNRSLYIACMHTLRSFYYEPYLSLVKPPYTSDPFPSGSTGTQAGTGSDPDAINSDDVSYEADSHVPPPIHSLQRETQVFDLFIALKTREDVWSDETYLHVEREDSFNDLFSVLQPRKRIEDLIRYYGLRYGSVTLSESPAHQKHSVHFSQVCISFAPRHVSLSLILPASDTRKSKQRITIAECTRTRDEQLEVAAKKLTKALGQWIARHR